MDRDDVSALRAALDRRHPLLEAAETDVVDKRELTDRVSVSRSTVDRGVRELERLGLLERANGGFRVTTAGTLALREYERTSERLAAIADASDLLSGLSGDTGVDTSVLVGSEVILPTTEAPYRPMRHLNDVIQRADRFRICATAVVPPQIDRFHRAVVENGLELTGITNQQSFDRLVADYRQQVVEAMDTGRYDLYLTDEPIPYGVVSAEGADGPEMCLSFCDQGIEGTIANDTPEAVAWADERIDSYVEAAELVTPG